MSSKRVAMGRTSWWARARPYAQSSCACMRASAWTALPGAYRHRVRGLRVDGLWLHDVSPGRRPCRRGARRLCSHEEGQGGVPAGGVYQGDGVWFAPSAACPRAQDCHTHEPVACMIPPAGLFDPRGGWMARMECIKVHYAETFIVLSVERRYTAACIRLPIKQNRSNQIYGLTCGYSGAP